MIGNDYFIQVSRRAWILLLFLALSIGFAGTAYAALPCYGCHGTTGDIRPLDDSFRNLSSGGFQGNHRTHLEFGATSNSCQKCHPGSAGYVSGHRDGKIKLSGKMNSSSLVTTYNNSTSAFSQTATPSLHNCSNVNCHFEATTPQWGSAAFTSPNDCDKCHGAPPNGGLSGAAGSHAKHNAYYPGVTNCQKCHPNNTTFQHATSAGNRNLAISFAAAPNSGAGAYSGALNDYLPSQTNVFGNCTATYCHSRGNKSSAYDAPFTTATWGGAAIDCKGCHAAQIGSGNIISSGSHFGHVAGSGGSTYSQIKCVSCHAATVNSGMVITDVTMHVNRSVDVAFDNSSSAYNGSYNGSSAKPASPSSKAPGSASGNCLNVYCHSTGQHSDGTALQAADYQTPTWGTASTGQCGTCHAVTGSTAHGGFLNYVKSGPAIASGKHTKHLSYTYGMTDNSSNDYRCALCHANDKTAFTTSDPTTGCTTICHNGTTATMHANNQVNVNIANYVGAAASYSGTPRPGDGYGACSSVYCHSDGLETPVSYATPSWSDSSTGACGTCHGVTAAAPPASAPHTRHLGIAHPYRIACAVCHNGKVQVTANSTVQPTYTNLTSHVNKLREVKFNAFNSFGNYSSANQSCNSAYCHSIGNTKVAAANLPGVYDGNIYAKPKWSDGPLTCNACHGRSTANGSPDYANGKMGSMSSNSHPRHVQSSAIACVECHEKTTKTGTTIRSTFPSKHVDGITHDVYFNLSGLSAGGSYNNSARTCSNTYCHGAAASLAWGGSTQCNSCHSANDATSGGGGINNWGSGTSAHTLHMEENTLLPSKYTNYSTGNLSSNSNVYRFGCASCHNPTQTSHANGPANINGLAQVFFGFTSPGKRPSYTYGAAGSADNGFNFSNGSTVCNATYCHSNGTGVIGAGSNGAAVSWTTAANSATNSRCKACHNYTAASGAAIATGDHTVHVSGYNFSCLKCHAATTIDGSTIADKTKHVNKLVNVAFNNNTTAVNGTYNGLASPMSKNIGSAYASCVNTYCHSKGTSVISPSAPNITATWGDSLDATCSGCHGGDNSAAYKMGSVGSAAHAKHIQTYSYGCVKCHKTTVSANRTISSSANHVNRQVNVTFNNSTTAVNGTYNGSVSPMFKLPGSAMGACGNIYCHSLGNTAVTDTPPLPDVYGGSIYAEPSWNEVGSVGCNACHGRSTENGMPDYTNGGPGAATANSHTKHISLGAISCSECHNRTTKTGTTIRTDVSPNNHVNRVINDIFFNLSGTASKNGIYTKVDKTCTNLVCHSNGRGTYKSAQWGVTATCDYCHPIAALGGAHAKHIDLTQTVAFYTYTANRSTAGTYNFGCTNCHPLVSTTNHARGPIVIDFRPAVAGIGTLRSKNNSAITASGPVGTANGGTSGTSGSSVICNNVYCHSNGYAINAVFATTPNWYGGSFTGDKCAACHGNSPNSTIVGSAAHYSTNFMGQGVTDGHVVGIHYDTIFTGSAGLAPINNSTTGGHGNATTATTISCNLCHYATVNITNNDKNVVCITCHVGGSARGESAISNKSNHVNGIADVSFNPINIRSKAQMLNAAVISPYSSVWTRTGGYKNAGSYDIAKQPLDTATMWDRATKSCSNVSCHNGLQVKWGSTNGSTSCQRCHPSM